MGTLLRLTLFFCSFIQCIMSQTEDLESECNFINDAWEGPLATDTCMKSVVYGGSPLYDSYIFQCDAQTNSIAAKSYWCNGENCVGTIDNCAAKGLLSSEVFSGDSRPNFLYSDYWNCGGRDDCDKVTIKYQCCVGSCYGGETADKHQTTYLQNMCWRQYSDKLGGIMLHCGDNELIIDEYKYNNCTDLLTSSPYNKSEHFLWETGYCSDMTYTCGAHQTYILFNHFNVFVVLIFLFCH
eukprot:212789_1